MPSPALDHHSGLPQGAKDLPIQQFVAEPTSVTPIARIASATGVPCATRTSTWRSLETISSGVCRFVRIVILLRLASHTSGWTTPMGADQAEERGRTQALGRDRHLQDAGSASALQSL